VSYIKRSIPCYFSFYDMGNLTRVGNLVVLKFIFVLLNSMYWSTNLREHTCAAFAYAISEEVILLPAAYTK